MKRRFVNVSEETKRILLCVFRREKNGGFLLQRREAWLVEKLVVEAVASA